MTVLLLFCVIGVRSDLKLFFFQQNLCFVLQKSLDIWYVVAFGYAIAAVNFFIMGPSPLAPWLERFVVYSSLLLL